MGAASLAFLATTLAAALALRLLDGRVAREWVLVVASAAFILAFAGDPVATLPYWMLAAGGFLAAHAATRAARSVTLLALAALVVAAWFGLRTVAPSLGAGPLAALGLSYAMFRILHLAVDARDGELGQPLTLRTYLCYLTFFPTYLAGPVQRFQHFAPQASGSAPLPGAADWTAAIERALAGLFQCTVLAGAAEFLFAACLAASGAPDAPVPPALALAAAALAWAAWLWASFAGYTALAIAAGRVLGVTVPENFAAPLRARNFLDLWSRWHITLSDWFRFYVFNPSLKAMLEAWSAPALAPWLGAAGYFLAFFLMGLWHGTTLAMVLYGLALGAGVSVNKLVQVALGQSLGRKGYARLCDRAAWQVAAQALALAYFVAALAFLWLPAADAARIGPTTWAGIAAAILAACGVLAAASRLPLSQPAQPSSGTRVALAAVQAAAAVGYLAWSGGRVPPLLYQWL